MPAAVLPARVGEEAGGQGAYLVLEFVWPVDREWPTEPGEHLCRTVEPFGAGCEAHPVGDLGERADRRRDPPLRLK